MDNSDESLNSKDYKGEEVVINFGFTDSAGSDTNLVWVDTCSFIAKDGKLLLQLNCVDIFTLLQRSKASHTSMVWNYPWQDATELAELNLPLSNEPIPDNLIAEISAHSDKCIWEGDGTGILERTLDLVTSGVIDVLLDDDDGYTTTEKPLINGYTTQDVLMQAMEVTKSYLLWKPDKDLHVIQPDAHASVYSYNTNTLFFYESESTNIVLPNRVYYWFINKVDPADPTTWVWTEGHAVDTDSYNKLGFYIDEHHNTELEEWEGIATQAEANSRATARLSKIQLSKVSGSLEAPMHCAQELFDAITVIDSNYTSPRTITGYVFGIERVYDRGIYKITLTLGGVATGYANGVQQVSNITKTSIGKPPTDPVWTVSPGLQSFIANIDFTSVDWDTISWTAGNIKLANGDIQSILAGSLDMTTTHYLYCIWGNSTLQNSLLYSDAIGKDKVFVAVASKASTIAQKAYVLNPHTDSILINTDKVMDGLVTNLKLGAEAVTEAKIAASAVTGGKIAALSIVGGHIQTLQIDSGHINTEAIVADKISAGAVTAVKINVATLDAITANCGTLTAGTINGVTIYAGAEAVKLSATGITIIGGKLTLKSPSEIHSGEIEVDNNGYLLLGAFGLTRTGTVYPRLTAYQLGSSSYPYYAAWARRGHFDTELYIPTEA